MSGRPPGRASPFPVGIAVFAKAPVPGYAKTRLAPRLGAGGAAKVQRYLVARTLATVAAVEPRSLSLWCAPDAEDPFLRAMAARFGARLEVQAGADLGARMHAAFVAEGGPLLLVGTDCPALAPDHLRACAARLAGGDDAVMLPAEDGGYVLIGLTAPFGPIFDGMEWGTATVAAETRRRLAAAGMAWAEPAVLPDLDRPEDLDRAVAAGLLPGDLSET